MKLDSHSLEILLNLASPLMIIVCQGFAYLTSKEYQNLYWEFLAWTAFFLWVRFMFMLRCNKYLSPVISMVINSFSSIASYMTMAFFGVLCFTTVF